MTVDAPNQNNIWCSLFRVELILGSRSLFWIDVHLNRSIHSSIKDPIFCNIRKGSVNLIGADSATLNEDQLIFRVKSNSSTLYSIGRTRRRITKNCITVARQDLIEKIPFTSHSTSIHPFRKSLAAHPFIFLLSFTKVASPCEQYAILRPSAAKIFASDLEGCRKRADKELCFLQTCLYARKSVLL